MDIGQEIIIGLSILLAVWFVVASAYNRRRGVNTYRWLQSGLQPLGKIGEAKWIGTSGSGARLTIPKAERPLRQVQIAFLLESRELLPLWLINRYLRRRRDLMILKADMSTVPTGELEISRGQARRLEHLVRAPNRNPWQRVPDELPAALQGIERGRYPDRMRAALSDLLHTYGPSVKRLSLARTSPHLILEIDLPQLTAKPGVEFFQQLQEAVARLAAARGPVEES